MRWIIRVVGVVVVLAMLGVAAVVMLPAERVAALAAERLGQALGREVTLTGEVRPTLWPHLGVRAEGLTVGNPGWVTEGPMIAAEALSVRVPWSGVLSGAPQIDEITLVGPEITLVRAADGRVSWSMTAEDAAPAGPAGDGAAPAAPIGITLAEIRDGALGYIDAGTGQTFRIAGLDARVSLPARGAATLAGQATVNGTALELSAEIAALAALTGGGLSEVSVALDWAGGRAGFDGALSLAPALDGNLTLDTTDPGPVLAILGAAMPDLPDGYGRERIALSGRVTLTDAGTAHLRDGQLRLDDTALALALDYAPGEERPLVRGTVTGARLALPGGGAAADGAAGGAAAAPGWSRAPIDVSGLFAADAEIALLVEEVAGAGVTVGPVDLRATLTRGRLVFDIDRIGTYGGTLTGQFVVNGRGGLSVGGDLLLAGVQLAPLLTDLAGYERLEGTGSASLQFLGVGNDMATIMDGLTGEGDLSLGAGAILGLDLAGMIRTLDTSFRGEGARTVYDQVSANFTIADGVLANDDLFLDAPWGEVTGAGIVDLGAQTLDYRLIPGLVTGAEGAALRVPVLITGPWADPSIRPDLEFLAEQELAEERARLEAEARARLDAEAERLENEARARANELLGTQFDAGTTTGEARDEIERRLREEAEQQLLRLLGGGN